MNDLVGTKIGEYEIVEHVGHGVAADVYKAYQAKLDRHVAIKILSPTFVGEQAFLARFQGAHSPGLDPERDLLVVFDDVDLPFGRIRLRPGGGAGGHNGMTHIIERLGRFDFPRLRFGVGRPEGGQDTAHWVLQKFAPDEEKALPGLVARAAEAAEAALVLGVRPAMDRFNRAPEAPA